MRGMRRIGISLALAFALSGAPAAAAVGEPPPSFDSVKEWIGQPLKWDQERGKVVILLFVEPENAPSKEALADLVSVQKAEEKNGLDACLITTAPRAAVEPYLARQKSRGNFPVAIDPDSAIRVYFQTAMCPYAAVIDRDGRISWEGACPAGRVAMSQSVREALARPRTVSRAATTPRFDPIWKSLETGDTKAAVAGLQQIQIAQDATPREVDDAKWLLKKLEIDAQRKLDAAVKQEADFEYADALAGYDAIADGYYGLKPADVALAKADALRKNAKAKKEIEASQALVEARKLEQEGRSKDALEKYRLIVSKWKGTKAAEKAKKKVDELEAKKK